MNEHADRDHSEQPTRDERAPGFRGVSAGLAEVMKPYSTLKAELAEKDATIAALQGVINEAAERMEKAEAALARVPSALLAAWDDGNATGLDGYIGPERGEQPDPEAIDQRERYVERAVKALRGEGA